MTDQPSLFGQRVPLPPDPGGGHTHHYIQPESLAAYDLAQETLPEKKRVVSLAMEYCGWFGTTAEEMFEKLHALEPHKWRTINTVAPCFTHLKKEGLIVWKGNTRKTKGGCSAKVWVTARTWVNHHLLGGTT